MQPMIDSHTKFLIENIPKIVKNFKYRGGPDLYFYLKTIGLVRKKPLNELFEDESDRFLELMSAIII